ncbi:MAG TPA: alpha/beta hydrolase [Alphaproteobacteria bacterium]|nr:alpha/beta hydrolase [Alphaproteobacteria bacterium]
MRIEDYPAQEPLSEAGRRYQDEVIRRGANIVGEEHAYGPDPYQGAILYRPEKPDGRVLAFFHGGGWTSGYKEWMAFMAPAFTAAGVLFVAMGYRLAPQHIFPTGYEDCARALAWLWRLNGREPIFVGGHSSGGHYASLLAVTSDWQESLGLRGGAIRGCLPISGVYDFTPGGGLTMRPRFLGSEGTERAASPLLRIGARPRPFLLAHGDKDFPHLIRQAEAMEVALRGAGGDVTRLVLADRDHFSASYAGGEANGPWVPKALAWMAGH